MRALDSTPLAAATAFLTRLPIGPKPWAREDQLLRSVPLFPLVGAGLGAAVGGAAVGLAHVLPAPIAGALAVALELALTGALHVDGLADSADGLAGRDRDHSLAIMRDHSLGAYGGAALTLDLLIKAAALGALAEEGALLPVVAALALSRATPLPLATALPYARSGEGTGRLLSERLRARTTGLGLAIAAAIAFAAIGLRALALLACVALVTAIVGAVARRRLGGVTGDVMGAAVELSAVLALIAAVTLEA